MQIIREYIRKNETAKTSDLARATGLSVSRVRDILARMEDVVYQGTTKNRVYKIVDKG